MTQEELNKIIENHQHWLRRDCVCWEDMRADLGRACLVGSDLKKADLRRAYLVGAYLEGADLRRACLVEANLGGADLRGAYLVEADLRGANLRGAYLVGAYLKEADLEGADLGGADLGGAYLVEANLERAFNIPFIPMTCPDTGSFIGWKKAKGKAERVIVKLLIPEDAKRSSATGRKCRCDKAEVLSIESLDGKIHYEIASSNYDDEFIYKVGKTVSVPDFCEDRFNECAAGIHFFTNREEAVRY